MRVEGLPFGGASACDLDLAADESVSVLQTPEGTTVRVHA